MTRIDILTYATKYDYDIFERFVGSLNHTGFSGKIYIIMNECDLTHINILKTKYDNIICLLDDLEKSHSLHINNHRFFVKQKYLNLLSFTCDYLLLCDFRDVLFQKNIEKYTYDENIDLYVFLEGKRFNQELQFNTKWIKRLEIIFNETIYDKISNNNIICCGTTIGNITSIKKYVNMMCCYILNYNIKTNLDQGIHNYIIYMNKIPNINVKLLSNKDNLVNTVGCDIHKLDENNNIVNADNDISYIVHQYDRFSSELKQKISNKHGYNFIK
jgi:hypothetical protein